MTFIQKKDINYLTLKGVDFNTDFPVFLLELYNYLQTVWNKKYHYELAPLLHNNIDEFNKYINYPSHEGYEILSDSFINYNSDIMSENSLKLLNYFYGIDIIY